MGPWRCEWCGAETSAPARIPEGDEALPLCEGCRRGPRVPADLASRAETAWDEEPDFSGVVRRLGLSAAATRELLERLGLITARERHLYAAEARQARPTRRPHG